MIAGLDRCAHGNDFTGGNGNRSFPGGTLLANPGISFSTIKSDVVICSLA